MHTDSPIIIERVANGFIVRPHYGYHGGDAAAMSKEDMFVFESFSALSKWLKEHFTEVITKADDD